MTIWQAEVAVHHPVTHCTRVAASGAAAAVAGVAEVVLVVAAEVAILKEVAGDAEDGCVDGGPALSFLTFSIVRCIHCLAWLSLRHCASSPLFTHLEGFATPVGSLISALCPCLI